MSKLSPDGKKKMGEFLESVFIGFWGLGIIVPFDVLGYVNNMYEFLVWFGIVFAVMMIFFTN